MRFIWNRYDFSFSRIIQAREGKQFNIAIDLRSTFVPTGIDLPTMPTDCYMTSVFLIPLDLSVALDSGSYTISIRGAQPAMFVVP